MEYDRYQQNSKLFIIGIICLLLCLSLGAFSLYIIPSLLAGWVYNIPEFILVWQQRLIERHNFSQFGAGGVICLFFLISTLISGYISYWASNRIDDEIYGLNLEKPKPEVEAHSDLKESFGFGFKVLLLIILTLVAIFFLQWLLTVPPPIQD